MMGIEFQFLNFLFGAMAPVTWAVSFLILGLLLWNCFSYAKKQENQEWSGPVAWGAGWRVLTVFLVIGIMSVGAANRPKLTIEPSTSTLDRTINQRLRETPEMKEVPYSPVSEEQLQNEMDKYQEEVKERGSLKE